ncbi:Gryzun, putative trafficking through golgi-domain-containing protein [Lipomyces tetrasporus]|uniref:Gryzun, putative trafficking through golgi-domain-containing protein n=1 Tax=Lipomyces tetrasporus TaxID=54092 RepID=A0AAD7QQ28_9ASCO|nr:Gryzun, putative trafficking through golgi-domain-containing protein [Lipomyces tetrasporus]KAJ8099394.1 Gryzun, putative trafficking through golgi-domain-containing protein [Lipomyces tetrasporus]
MDVYPPEYLCHNLPLMLVSGLTTSPSKTSQSAWNTSNLDSPLGSPNVDTSFPNGPELFKAFTEGAEGGVWEESAVKAERKAHAPVFRVLAVGNDYQLPAKKSSPLSPVSVSSFSSSGHKSPSSHSPLSPLSPESPLFPDGIISQFWLRKYRNALPAVFVYFREIFMESDDTQSKVSHDNDLIKELSDLKKQFSERNVKFVAVVVSRRSILQSIDLNDRISYLRKNTSLDAKSGLLFLPPCSPLEIQIFAKDLKQALYPIALDFYSTLLKHARRKRGRNGGSQSPPLPSSQHLSAAGWNIRYEFKQAVFAEFRQENDVAIKLYGIAYESLLEYFDSIAIDSPRWNEARMILDTMAFKILKCNLYQNQPVMAQKVFNVHIESVSALVEKRFSTKDMYSYFAWKAQQYWLLAQLLDLAPEDISPKSVPFTGVNSAIVGPDFPSANVLHHSGFQYLCAARLTMERCRRTGDSLPQHLELYLVPPPEQEQNFDHAGLVLSLLETAYARFSKGDGSQTRMQAYIAHEIAHIHFQNENYVDALKYFHLSESEYRREKWYTILGSMISEAIVAARKSGNTLELVKLQFESLSREFAPWNSGLAKISDFLDGSECTGGKPEYTLDSDSIVCFVEAHFAFMAAEAHLATSVIGQLTLRSQHSPVVGAVKMSSVQLNFTGGLKPILITHDDSVSGSRAQKLELMDMTDEYCGAKACLVLQPGEVRTFEMSQPLKMLGTYTASSLIVTFEESSFTAKLAVNLETEAFEDALSKWWIEDDGKLYSQRLTSSSPRSITVIPKQSHVDIVSGLKGPAYIGEKLIIPLTITSREDEDLQLSVKLRTQDVEGQFEVPTTWTSGSTPSDTIELGTVSPSSSAQCQFSISMPTDACDLVVDVTVSYRLLSEPDISIVKNHTIDIPVIFPFQVSYDLTPRIYPRRWPSPFFVYNLESHSPPITKRWCLSAVVDAVDLQHLEIHDYNFDISNVVGVDFKLLEDGPRAFQRDASSTDAYQHNFIIDVTNNDPMEKRIATADAKLTLSWRRTNMDTGSDEKEYNSFTMPTLKLTFPLLEPRVLMDVQSTSSENVHLMYFIENATSHLLTFSVTLDLNNDMSLSYPIRHQLRQQSHSKDFDDHDNAPVREKVPLQNANFAYEGAKQVGVRVLPYSSRRLDFGLLPLAVTSGWQRVPALRVYDTHFKKSLSVFPASEKFRVDFKTGAVYVNISSSPDGNSELSER